MITGQQTKAVYLTDGTQTEFPLPFFFFDQGDVVVSTVDQYGVETQITTGYEVSGAQDEDGGTATFAAPPAAGLKLVLRRRTARKQETRYPESGKFPSRTVETDFDKLVAIAQELTEEVGRCVQTPPDDSIDRDDLVQELLAARGAAAASAGEAEAARMGAEEAEAAAEAAQAGVGAARDAAEAARVAAEAAAEGVAQAVADARQDVLASAAFVPIGAILDFPVNTVPVGFLVCAGQVVTREAYPDLVAYLTGDPLALSATLPDLRGEFRRGADLGRGVDAGRVVGSAQGHQMQYHRHSIGPYYTVTGTDNTSSTPRWSALSRNRTQITVNTNYAGDTENGSENRPRNVAVVSCIKAYHAPMAAAPVDLTEVLDHLDALAAVMSPSAGKFCCMSSTDGTTQSLAAATATQLAGASTLSVGAMDWRSGEGFQMTVPEAGTYRIGASCAPATGGGTWTMQIRIDGETVATGYSPSIGQVAVDHIQTLAAGAVVTVYVTCSVAATLLRAAGQTRLTMERVR